MIATQGKALRQALNDLLVGRKAPFLIQESGKLFAQANKMRISNKAGKSAIVNFYHNDTLLFSYNIQMKATFGDIELFSLPDELQWFARIQLA